MMHRIARIEIRRGQVMMGYSLILSAITLMVFAAQSSLNLLQQPHAQIAQMVSDLAYSSDGKLVAVAYNNDRLNIYTNTPQGLQAPLRTLMSPQGQSVISNPTIRSLAWKPASHLLAVSTHSGLVGAIGGGLVTIQDIDTQAVVTSFVVNDAFNMIWSPDGRQLALVQNGQSSADNSYILVWDTTSWTQIAQMWGKTDALISLSWNRDSKELVSSSFDSSVVVWDVASQQIIHTIRPPQEEPDMTLSPANPYAAWSPDGRLIAIGDEKGVVEAWNTNNWQLAWQVTNLSQRVGNRALTWSPNGQLLAATDYDDQNGSQDVQILNGQTGARVRTLTPVDNQMPGLLRWAPDGNNVVTGGDIHQLAFLSLTTPADGPTKSPTLGKLVDIGLCPRPAPPATDPVQWDVGNPNTVTVNFTWTVKETGETGSGSVPPKGDVYVTAQPNPNGPTSLQVYVNGVLQFESKHC